MSWIYWGPQNQCAAPQHASDTVQEIDRLKTLGIVNISLPTSSDPNHFQPTLLRCRPIAVPSQVGLVYQSLTMAACSFIFPIVAVAHVVLLGRHDSTAHLALPSALLILLSLGIYVTSTLYGGCGPYDIQFYALLSVCAGVVVRFWLSRAQSDYRVDGPFKFMNLPPELRWMVYDEVFVNVKTLCLVRRGDHPADISNNMLPHVASLPLTCKKVYGETRILLVRAMKLEIRRQNLWNGTHVQEHHFLRSGISSFTLDNVRVLEGLPLAVDLRSREPNRDVGKILKLLPSLKICVFFVEYYISRDDSPSPEMVDRWRLGGAVRIFRHWSGGQDPRDYLEEAGVDALEMTKDSGIQLIVAFQVGGFIDLPDDPVFYMVSCIPAD